VKDEKEKLLFELRAAREAVRFYQAKVKKILKDIATEFTENTEAKRE
jgi:hypothetical protein